MNDISQAILDVWRERFGDVVGNNEPERLRDRLDRCSGKVREVFRSRCHFIVVVEVQVKSEGKKTQREFRITQKRRVLLVKILQLFRYITFVFLMRVCVCVCVCVA